MARKRHHSSHKKHHHLTHAESEHMLSMKKHKGHRRNEEMHEHHSPMHGHRLGHIRHKYDTLRHEPDHFNDERHHDAEPVAGGPYHYDREGMEQHRLMEARSGRYSMYRKGAMRGEHYAGAEPRRRQEMMDAGMIHEDHTQIANLPQHVEIRPYPKGSMYLPEDLDDTIRGVDRQMDYDDAKKLGHFYPKKV